MLIRAVKKEDLASILYMATKGKTSLAIKFAEELEDLEAQVEKGSSNVLVIQDVIGNIHGYAQINKVNQYKVKVNDFYIAKQSRGKGYGTNLLTHLVSIAPSVDIDLVKPNAIKFFEKQGFTKVSEDSNTFSFKAKPNKSNVFVNKSNLVTRYEELEGVKYLVAPVIMVQEQVMNGELLLSEEIAKSVAGWNGRPVVVYHPLKNGDSVSANSPEIVQQYEVGKLFNTTFDGKQLKAEVWIDVSKAESKLGDFKLALQMIQNGDPLEVSTGYFVNTREMIEGEFNGKAYIAVQKDIIPDHLALLPTQIGACSFEDGCGIRANSEKQEIAKEGGKGLYGKLKHALSNILNNLDEPTIVDNELSGSETHQKLTAAIRAKLNNKEDVWVIDYYPDSQIVIFEVYQNNKYMIYQSAYTTGPDTVALDGDMTEVERKIVYEPVTTNVEEGDKMKEKMIATIIANSNGALTEDDILTLNKLSDCTLLRMVPEKDRSGFKVNCEEGAGVAINAKKTAAKADDKEDEEEEVETKTKAKKTVANEVAPTMEEYLAGIPDADAREFIQNSMEAAKEKRTNLLASLTANANCVFSADELNAMTTCQLEKIETILTPVPATNVTTNYASRGIQKETTNNEDAERYTKLTVNIFDQIDKEGK